MRHTPLRPILRTSSRRLRYVLPAVCLLGIVVSSGRCLACNIPVFRYALERWPVQPYVLTVFHSKPLSAAQQKRLDALQNGSANVEVVDADLTASPDDQTLALWHAQKNPVQPWAVLSLPMSSAPDGPGGGESGSPAGSADGGPGEGAPGDQAHAPTTPVAWAGTFDSVPQSLTDSPVRRDVMSRILKGASAVWIILDTGDKAKDDAAAKVISDELKVEEQNITLVRPNPDDPGPQLMSSLPLELKFSVVHLSRTDAGEAMFRKMLFACDSTHSSWPQASAPADKAVPVVFVVFGRGRALPPLVGPQVTADNVDQISQFVTGPCACEIKDLNPGTDLLTSTDWDGGLSADSTDVAGPAHSTAPPPAPHVPLPASVPIAPGLTAVAPPPPAPPAAPLAATPAHFEMIRPAMFAAVAIASIGLILSAAALLRSRSKPKIS